jgi:hypothetical protein
MGMGEKARVLRPTYTSPPFFHYRFPSCYCWKKGRREWEWEAINRSVPSLISSFPQFKSSLVELTLPPKRGLLFAVGDQS